jgi:hypothetical protein
MRNVLLISLTLSLALAGACNRTEQATPGSESAVAATDLSPEQLGEIGGQIQKEPARAHEILSNHGLNEQSLEAAVRRVTEDPDASKRYAAAFQKASAS